MLIRVDTVKEATERWVETFNAIPREMICRLMKHESDAWSEVTVPKVGDIVYAFKSQSYGKVMGVDDDNYIITLKGGAFVTAKAIDIEVVYYENLPIWRTMWSFGNTFDDDWLKNEKGLDAMSKCGFRIFEHEEFGHFFGIDGAGYDFYEAHWIPLYKARGLQWHSIEECSEE